MENKTTPIQYFEQFAADRLKIHLAELNTSYENEELISRPCNAYSEHKEIGTGRNNSGTELRKK